MSGFQPGTSNRTAIRIVPETTFGVTPATPALQNLRYTGENVVFNQRSVSSDEIRSDRSTADLIRVGAEVSGDINFELSFGSFDPLIEAALASVFGAPTTGLSTMKNGVLLKSFTLQKHFQDLAVPIFQNFRGCRIGGMSLDFRSGQILSGAFSVMGLDAVSTNAQITGATFTNPGAGSDVLNAVTNLIEIKKNTVAMATKIRSMTLDLNNNLRGQEAIGTLGNVGIALGRLEVMGNIELYFENGTEYTTFLNNDDFSISFKLLDAAANYYTFTLPRVKYEEGTINSGQLDQDLMVNGKWRALYDSVSQSMIQVNRYDSP